VHENELKQKEDHPKDPLTSTNGGLNNRQFTLREVVTKKKQELKRIKKTNERYELKQLPTWSMQLLEYNPMGYNVEGICNAYLQHHPIRVNI
jgi:hypothetical protein